MMKKIILCALLSAGVLYGGGEDSLAERVVTYTLISMEDETQRFEIDPRVIEQAYKIVGRNQLLQQTKDSPAVRAVEIRINLVGDEFDDMCQSIRELSTSAANVEARRVINPYWSINRAVVAAPQFLLRTQSCCSRRSRFITAALVLWVIVLGVNVFCAWDFLMWDAVAVCFPLDVITITVSIFLLRRYEAGRDEMRIEEIEP